MKPLFITGAASALGQAILDRLSSDLPIIALQHKRPIPERANQTIITGAIGEADKYKDAVKSCDTILHLAGMSHSKTAQTYFDVNTTGTTALLSCCGPEQHFIYMSTRCINPQGGAYSESKHLAEQVITQSTVPYSIIRPSEVYGTHGNEGIDALIRLARKRGLLLDIVHKPPVTYSPIPADSVANFTTGLLENGHQQNQIFTLCGDQHYNAKELESLFGEVWSKKITRIPIPSVFMKIALSIPLPFIPAQPDQLARLVVPKEQDNASAKATGFFQPSDFRSYLKSL